MLQQIYSALRPVRLRQRGERALRFAMWGLSVGSLLGVVGLVAIGFQAPLRSDVIWFVSASGGLGGALVGVVWPCSWRSVARRIDLTYGFKDATTTSLSFARRSDIDPITYLQIHDTLERLRDIDPQRVVPWRMPRSAPLAVASLGGLWILCLLPAGGQTSVASPSLLPNASLSAQADLLEESMLQELDELANDVRTPEFDALARELEKEVQGLRDPSVDQREALAKLSKMQAVIIEAMEESSDLAVDAQLQQLAEALQVADATSAISESLRQANYELAAEQMEALDPANIQPQERQAVAETLAKLHAKLEDRQSGNLSKAAEQMAQGLENDNPAQAKAGFDEAAKASRWQATSQRVAKNLAIQLTRLAECKGRCQGSAASGNRPGGNIAPSDHASTNWGEGASNSPLGENQSHIDTQRQKTSITGQLGEGDSKRETILGTSQPQQATREYQERYAEYRKQMEHVLDHEPLPLGDRETVKRYFEAIRPTTAEVDAVINSAP